ncbi:MAG: sugar ABC transporter substrate-binding protein [Firmicutes bacterium]|jgi:multiple sugar transport system substrate-binding protein|nr:sugar ABC transporter substrate-binding protein [Bacillota bacterium]
MRKTAFTVVLVGLLCSLFAMAGAAASDVNLTVAMWIAAGPEVDETQAILDTYMAENKGVKLELMYQPFSGYHEKMLTLAAGGLTPDVMVLSRIFLPTFVENGIVQPIDHWLARDGINPQRDLTEIASGSWKGRIYGVPIWGGPLILCYNADLFSQMGLPQPSELSRRNDWSWDRLIDLGKKVTRDTDGDGIKDVFALPAPGYWEAVWYTYIRTFGGDVIRDGRSVADSPETARGLQLFSDIRWQHHIAPQPGESADFFRGTLATYYTWMSETPNRYNTVGGAFTVDLVTMPSGPAGRFHTAGGCPVTVSATTAHPEEAYKFATWFAVDSDEWKLRGIPASMNVTRRQYRDFLAQFFASPDVLIDALSSPTAPEPSVHPKITELQAAWTPIINGLASGTISGVEAAAQMGRSTAAIIGSN